MYSLTDKYNELDDNLLVPKTEGFDDWLKITDNNVKLLSMLSGCISWDVAERFELDDRFFDALENEYQYTGFTLTKEEVTKAVAELLEQGYLEEK